MTLPFKRIIKNKSVNLNKQKKANTDNNDGSGNVTKHVGAECRIIVYRWKQQNLTNTGTSNSKLSATQSVDISSQIMTCSFNKSLSSPSGTFTFTVGNSLDSAKYPEYKDWKDFIKPGTWCAIYMTQDGDLYPNKEIGDPVYPANPEKLRCIGYIERVAIKTELNDKGGFDATFEFTGRDFGVIYEETTIWHNLFKYEETALNAIAGSQLNVAGNKTLDKVIRTVHDLFYAPAKLKFTGLFKDQDKSLTELAKQWLMPSQLLNDIGMSFRGDSFYGNVDNVLDFYETTATIPVSQPLDYLSGNAWEKLRELSIPSFHELFAETDLDGSMKLTFRPIPWAIDKKKYPKAGSKIELFKNLSPRSTIPAVDILEFNLGEDNHNRKNHFLVTVATSLYKVEDNISPLSGSRFPYQVTDSVKRHGFRPIHVQVNSLTLNEMLNDGKADKPKLVEYNEILFDYWNNAVFFESGQLDKFGSNDIKIGKTLQFEKDVPYVTDKIFYIEEYTDDYIVMENGASEWTQTIKLTRGAEEYDLNAIKNFSFRNKALNTSGEYTGDDNE